MRRIGWLVVALLCSVGMVEAQTIVGERLQLSSGPCTLRSGSGAPSTSLGSVCDIYHRTDSPYTVYVKTAASTWTALVRLPGDTSLTTVGALNAGSITSGFGSINVGADAITGGAITGTTGSLTTSVTTPIVTAASNLTLSPTGDVAVNPTGNDVLPTTNYDINVGALDKKFLALHAAELWVETLVAQNTIATIGGRVLVGPTTTLTADIDTDDTTISLKHNQAATGDILHLEANGKFERMIVTAGPSGSGPYSYTVTRNYDGGTANEWFAGDAVFNTGTTGDGTLDLYSVSSMTGSSKIGPSIVGMVRTGSGYNDLDARWAIGNLNGWYGYSADTYGAAFGDNSNAWVKIDPTNGVRIGEGSDTYFEVDPDGNALFSGQLTIGAGRNQLANTISAPTVRAQTTDGDGTDWGQVFTNTGLTTTFACNNDNRRLETLTDGSGTSTGGACVVSVTGTPSALEATLSWGPTIPVSEGVPYEWSFYCGVQNADFLQARIEWYDGTGSLISTSFGSHHCTTSTIGTVTLASWGRAWVIDTAPEDAVQARPQFALVHTASANPDFAFMRLFFGEAQPGQTDPSPWAPGGMTLITGDYLASDLVIANTIRSEDVTDIDTGTGFWLDASTDTPEFRVGNPSGKRIEWDGTDITLTAGNLTVDGSSVRIAPVDFSGFQAARGYVFDVATGTLGVGGNDGATNGRFLILESTWSGAANRLAQITMLARSSNSGSGLSDATVQLGAQANSTSLVSISATNVNITANGGTLDLDSTSAPELGFPTSATAGTLAGYLQITVDGTNYRIPIYNP